MSSDRNIVLVIGATGAQGIAVIDALLRPTVDGVPSPFSVRALTRVPESERSRELARRGVEIVKGSTNNLESVRAALQGAYGAFVNTDSFTIGEEQELFQGIRIFELAKEVKTLKHYVWSSLDNVFKKGGFDPKYYAEHYTGKCRVADWIHVQDSVVDDDSLSWSILTTGPYMDMLQTGVFGPLKQRPDGTFVFVSPLGKGHIPMISLEDLGFFARYIFDHRAETSAQELEIASDWVDWGYLVETFEKVTGQRAEYLPLTVEQWFGIFVDEDVHKPVAYDKTAGEGVTTWKENFTRWWLLYRDEIVKRDFDWIRRVHPSGHTLESWIRAKGYDGKISSDLLKNAQDGKGPRPNIEHIVQL
ncbi:nmrA-family protein [Trametes maxima]|nr:nmrA-family protein [Trametes maxima]